MSADFSVDSTKAVSELKLDWRQDPGIVTHPDSLQNSIHLWTFDLDALDLETLSQRATVMEKSRAARILNTEKRLLYLGGRVGLRLLLSRYTGLEPHDLRIGYGHRGKPRLENCPYPQELTFNYTLSGDKVLYAISADRQLGVDLEKLPRKISDALMARSKLAFPEQEAWNAVPEEQKGPAMLSCWTRKEAYGKVLGVGIRYFMQQVVLFTDLQNPLFEAPRAGLFETTSHSSMPELLQGVQIALPFNGVATLMYGRHLESEPAPSLSAACLKI